jgi:hypothetical protein
LGNDNTKISYLNTIDQSPALSVQTQIIRNAPVETSNMQILSRDQNIVETKKMVISDKSLAVAGE